jgi:xanthine dehydrogenase accessory factor
LRDVPISSGRPIIVRYDAADPLGLDVGLSCGGSIDVLIEPFAATQAWQAICRAIQHERAAALAIGLTPPALIGRQLVVFDDGTAAGSVDAAPLSVSVYVSLAGRRMAARSTGRASTCTRVSSSPPRRGISSRQS